MMSRLLVVLAVVIGASVAPDAARAQAAPVVAAPYYGPEAFVAAFTADGARPRSAGFARSAGELARRFAAGCADGGTLDAGGRAALREAWLAAARDWERLDTVSEGPTLARRSARSLDFRPSRSRLIVAAIKAHGQGPNPPGAGVLERIGTPARGLPAIEWLLWDPAAPADAASCRYATGLADAVAREAEALAAAHAEDAGRHWAEDGEAAAARAAEIVNQWLAGLEALRWRQLGKPLAVVDTTDAGEPDPHRDIWPRPPSASHRAAWQARWDVLKALAVGPAPTDGFGPQPAVPPAIVSLEALLRGRGLADDADAWVGRVQAADAAITALTTPVAETRLPSVDRMREAVAALNGVKQFMQERLAPSLKIALGFSDADGD